MLAAMSRDKEGMLRVLGAMRAFAQVLPRAERGSPVCLRRGRAAADGGSVPPHGPAVPSEPDGDHAGQLPDVSGLMHMFPFQREYRREAQGSTPEEKAFYDRMERFAMGKGGGGRAGYDRFLWVSTAAPAGTRLRRRRG